MKSSLFVLAIAVAVVSANVIQVPLSHRPKSAAFYEAVRKVTQDADNGIFVSNTIPLTNNDELDYYGALRVSWRLALFATVICLAS